MEHRIDLECDPLDPGLTDAVTTGLGGVVQDLPGAAFVSMTVTAPTAVEASLQVLEDLSVLGVRVRAVHRPDIDGQ